MVQNMNKNDRMLFEILTKHSWKPLNIQGSSEPPHSVHIIHSTEVSLSPELVLIGDFSFT